MWQYQNTNELYHFGVPGMKWKNRKSRSERKEQRKQIRKTTIDLFNNEKMRIGESPRGAAGLIVKKGMDKQKALDKARRRNLAASGALLAAGVLSFAAAKSMSDGNKAMANMVKNKQMMLDNARRLSILGIHL